MDPRTWRTFASFEDEVAWVNKYICKDKICIGVGQATGQMKCGTNIEAFRRKLERKTGRKGYSREQAALAELVQAAAVMAHKDANEKCPVACECVIDRAYEPAIASSLPLHDGTCVYKVTVVVVGRCKW